MQYEQAARYLPPNLRKAAKQLPRGEQNKAREFRLRSGQFFTIGMPDGEIVPDPSFTLSSNEITQVLENASLGSIHTVLDKVRQGYMTVEGGHRIGLCGAAVVKDGCVDNFRYLSSLCIRIAHEIIGAADEALPGIFENGKVCNTLILSPPGLGKTTLLRDIVRQLSHGTYLSPPLRVAVADERSEIAGCFHGTPQFNIGPMTDVLDGAPKAAATMMLVRSMNPQVLALDEITAPEDITAIEACIGCGVSVLATAHAWDMNDLLKRPLYRPLSGIFKKAVLIRGAGQKRNISVLDVSC